MEQITPTKIFRKTATASDLAAVSGFVILASIVIYFIYSVF
jgi:hypothetical protein